MYCLWWDIYKVKIIRFFKLIFRHCSTDVYSTVLQDVQVACKRLKWTIPLI